MLCLLPGRSGRPVIFTSRLLSNTEHCLENFFYLVIRNNNIFQVYFYHLQCLNKSSKCYHRNRRNHRNHRKLFAYSFPTVSLILIFFIHYEFFWIHNASGKIHRFGKPKQPKFLVRNAEKKIEIDLGQQKQRKLILTDNKNIFTKHFRPMQHLEPNFITDGIRNSWHNRNN